jgi:phosphoribosylformylglycinamidine cyclo-ligase
MLPDNLVYSGSKGLTEKILDLGLDVGKLILSPTRTYAPIIKDILDKYRDKINGMIHCSGGGQTKILHFIEDLHVIKDNMFDIPPLFKLIQNESNTSWKEMYKVFNMGHRMELYVDEKIALDIIEISKSFNVGAKIIGRVEDSPKSKLTICSEKGEFIY